MAVVDRSLAAIGMECTSSDPFVDGWLTDDFGLLNNSPCWPMVSVNILGKGKGIGRGEGATDK